MQAFSKACLNCSWISIGIVAGVIEQLCLRMEGEERGLVFNCSVERITEQLSVIYDMNNGGLVDR